jgi:Family of unknown function (DUF6496)
MPERQTIKKAKEQLRRGRSPSTAAGEFVREEMHHIREGKHGARSAKQAIAIGLSKARRAGVPLKAPKRGGKPMRKATKRAYAAGQRRHATSQRRSKAMLKALRREPRAAASHRALSTQAHRSAIKRGPADLRRAARKAAATRKRSK